MQKYLGEILLFFVTLLAAVGWFFSKYAIEELPSVGFIGIRFSCAALIFLPLAYKLLKQLPMRDVFRASMVGLVFTLNLFCWIQAITFSKNFGEGAFLVSLSMLIAPLVSWLFFKQRPARLFWYSLPIATLGMFFLTGAKAHFDFSLGTIFFLLCSLSAAVFFVLNSQLSKKIHPLPLTTIQLAITGILCSLYSVCIEDWSQPISDKTWWWLLASVIVATNLRFLLQTIGQRHSSVTSAAIIMTLEPVWTLILSIWLLSETLTWSKLTGSLLILTALLVYRLPKKLKST